MANERFGMMCPICKDAFYLGKHLCYGIYNNDPKNFDRLSLLYSWMWKHLTECRQVTEFGDAKITVFDVVAEGHPDLLLVDGLHWNRHKAEDFEI